MVIDLDVETSRRNGTHSQNRNFALSTDESLSSIASDSSDEELSGIKPIKSNFLGYQTRPCTALAKKERPDLGETLKLTKKKLNIINKLKYPLPEDKLIWMKEQFKHRECISYIDNNGTCLCGRTEKQHITEMVTNNTDKEWSTDHHTQSNPTNAIGRVHFKTDEHHGSRYVRLAHNSSPEDVLHLICEHWKLPMPGLIISMYGSTEINIPHKLYNIILRDLTKVAKISSAWMFSSGVDVGAPQIVGTALSTHGFPVPGIAFCSWGAIQNVESLLTIDEEVDSTVRYDPGDCEGKLALESHHTHILLADHGKIGCDKAGQELRTSFEMFMKDDHAVPFVYVMVGGTDEDGLRLVEDLQRGNLAVFVKGTGGFCDLFCQFKEHMGETLELCSCSQDAECELMKENDALDFAVFSKFIPYLDFISIFDYGESKDLDACILKLLVSNKPYYPSLDNQLELAIKWSRLDVAEHAVHQQKDSLSEHRGGLTKILFHALQWDHPKFAGLLIENGADIYDIQANINYLYEAAYFSPRSSHVIQLLCRYCRHSGEGDITVKTINHLLNRLIGRGYRSSTGIEVDPYYELCLWAVVMLRDDLATLLWKYTQDPIRCALVACNMLFRIKHDDYCERDDDKRRVKALQERFEALARAVLEKAWLMDVETCHKAMLSKWTRVKGYNYLDLAFHAHARTFMAHQACQEILDHAWRGKFKRDVSTLQIVAVLIFPPLCLTPVIPFERRVSYRRAIQGRYKMQYIDKLYGVEALYVRAKAFYTAPVAKFCLTLILYMIFLCFHSYVLFYDMHYFESYDKAVIHWPEIVVWLWVASMIFSEVTDCIGAGCSYSTKVRYLSNSWNRMDVGIWSVYVIGLIFRLQTVPLYYHIGRNILACDTLWLFIRLLQILTSKPYLGPILLMIREMLKDVAIFLLLLVIFLLGFGVAYVALLIPPARFGWKSLSAVFVWPYFQMFGEFYLEAFELAENSSYTGKDEWTGVDGEIKAGHSFVAMALLVLWILVSSVTLVNLLIAMFSDTYRCIKDNQMIIWKFQRYQLLTEYRKSFLPPPFSFLHYFIRLLKKCCGRVVGRKTGVAQDKQAKSQHWKDSMLRTFIQDARDEYLSKHEGDKDSEILEKLSDLEHHLESIRRVGSMRSTIYN